MRAQQDADQPTGDSPSGDDGSRRYDGGPS